MTEMRFSPVLLIGLGDYGSEIAQDVARILSLQDPALKDIITCFTLRNTGEFFTDKSSEAVFLVEGLVTNPSEFSPYQHNYNKLCEFEKTISSELLLCINGIQNKAVLDRLKSAGYEIGERVKILFFSTLFDPIGSSAIIPMVGFLESLRLGLLGGLRMEKELFAFFPDLFNAEKVNDLAYCRSYTCLQELDSIADHPDLVSYDGVPPFYFMWLFTGKNEQGVDVGNFTDLTPMLGEFIWSFLSGQIGKDVSFSRVLAEEKEGQVTRYSSLGLSKLHYPRELILEALKDYVSMVTLETRKLIEPSCYEGDLVAAEVKDFLITARLDRLLEELSVSAEGTTIWRDFSYKSRISENLSTSDFIAEVQQDAIDFERSALTGMFKQMAQRRDTLMQTQLKNLFLALENALDQESKGPGYCQAFMDLFQGRYSPYIKNEPIDISYKLNLLDCDTKVYFNELLKEHLPPITVEENDDVQTTSEDSDKCPQDSEPLGLSNSAEITIEAEKTPKSSCEGKVDNREEKEPENLEEPQDAKSAGHYLTFEDAKADPAIRRKLLEILDSKAKKEIEETSQKLADTEEKYNDAKWHLRQTKESREKWIRSHFLIIPVLGAIAWFAVWLFPWLFGGISLFNSLMLAVKTFPAPVIIYFVWAFVRFLAIQHQLHAAENQYQAWKDQKIALCHRIQSLFNQMLYTRFKHALLWGLASWADEYRNGVREAAALVNNFQVELSTLYQTAKENWQTFTFPNNLFVRSIVDKHHLERYIDENPILKSEIDRFFASQSLSSFFKPYRETGTLASMANALKSLSDEIFRDIGEQTIEDFMRKEAQAQRLDASKALSQLAEATKAFILLNIERGQDVSEAVDYLGVLNPTTSFAKEVYDKQGMAGLQYYDLQSKDFVVMTRLKVGYPAFHIGLVKYGARLLANWPDSQLLYVNPQWQMKDLIPSQLTLGDSSDVIRRILCLGKAFNLIHEDEGGISFDGKCIAVNATEFVELLRSFRGVGLRKKMEEAIEQVKMGENALDRLVDYLDKNRERLDTVDIEILNEVIAELNPLA